MTDYIERQIEQDFPIPEGLKFTTEIDIDVEDNGEGLDVTGGEDEDVDLVIDVDDEDEEDTEESNEEDVQAPQNMTIVSQSVRTSPSGGQVVDVVIEVESSKGALTYDVRVTKV